MFIATHLVGFAGGGKSIVTLFDRTTGTNIGNMTSGGGLAAGFDGTNSQVHSSSPLFGGQVGWIGKTFPQRNPISRVEVYPTSDFGYINNFDTSVTISLYGKAGSAPASATDGVLLGSTTFTDTTTGPQTVSSSNTSTEFDHCWVAIDTGVVDIAHASELIIYVLT